MVDELEKINNLKQQIRNHIEMIEIHNAKIYKRQGKQEAKEEIIEMIKEANIEYSSDYTKPLQKCEQCGHDLTPHINHEIDQFYKLIMRKLKDGDE